MISYISYISYKEHIIAKTRHKADTPFVSVHLAFNLFLISSLEDFQLLKIRIVQQKLSQQLNQYFENHGKIDRATFFVQKKSYIIQAREK